MSRHLNHSATTAQYNTELPPLRLEQFVEAHALVILGYWPNGTFPTDLTTTATTTTTVAPTTTTTTAPTTATSTTTTTPATSTTSPTSTASPTTALTTTTASPTTALTTITTSQTTTTHTTTTTPIITTTSTTTKIAMTTGLQLTTNNEQSSTVTETTTKTPTTQGHTSSSTDIMATSEGTNQGSAAENIAQCVCACSIKNVTALTTEELQQKLAQLRKELTVNYTELSSYFRKLNSMPDSRPSAQGIGIIGVGLIALFIFFIIFLDLQFLVRTAQTMRYSFGGNSINSI
ncbi:uncharacterized protein DDB_G0290587-like [Argopecten irradians]|uniref:uncharacterized protein DDB_G0290587-like n=1 Tax=Argopecten irradians TaxID=31199 RepID=UPI0037173E46